MNYWKHHTILDTLTIILLGFTDMCYSYRRVYTTIIRECSSTRLGINLQEVVEGIDFPSSLSVVMTDEDNSIPVRYINNTSNVDFEVVVFTRNYNTKTPKIYYVAWQVLRAQSSVDFTFSSKIQVGAFYKTKGQTVRAGPFDAELGSTWKIVQNQMQDTATLKKIEGVKDNPLNSIVVQSKCPTTWNGRMFNVGIYKNEKLLLTHEDVHVGDQVDFIMYPILFFGIVRNVNVGDVFSSLEVMSYLQEFDLQDYPDGMEVTLNEEPTGGMYTFTAVNKVLNDYSG